MTWVDPIAIVTGQMVTAAVWNQDVVDNPQWLHDNLALRPIANTTLAAAASISFTNIPSTYAHLLLVATLHTNSASAHGEAWVRFGGASLDTGNNYNYTLSQVGTTTIDAVAGGSYIKLWKISGEYDAGAQEFNACFAVIPHYTETAIRRSIVGVSWYQYSDYYTKMGGFLGGGQWKNTADVIQQITVGTTITNFMADSRVTLYGLM